MGSNSPWSVKGIEPETREAAKIGARHAGMTLGQWLSRAIRTAAATQLAGASRAPAGTDPLPGPLHEPRRPHRAEASAATERAIRRLTARLDRKHMDTERRRLPQAAPGASPRAAGRA